MEFAILFAIPTIGGIYYGIDKLAENCMKEDHQKFKSYLKRNQNVDKNIKKLTYEYTSNQKNRINMDAFYGALWILFNKPEKTRRLKGSNCEFSIAYMIKKYLKYPSKKNKNNLLEKMVQYDKLGALLKKEKDGIRIISLLIVLLNLSPTFLPEDKKTFYIKLPTKDNLIGPYDKIYI
jgi:hypothetical protein